MPILPLITGLPDTGHVMGERHVCVDTTASGGNAALLGGAARLDLPGLFLGVQLGMDHTGASPSGPRVRMRNTRRPVSGLRKAPATAMPSMMMAM